jgi:hypothetical protein
VGEYQQPAYGVLKIGMKDGQLQFDFHKIQLPLTRFHSDRFDTPDDEIYGKWSVNFVTNPQGDVGTAVMSLDEAEASFTRRPKTVAPKLLQQLAGTYETPSAVKFQVVLKEDGSLYLVIPGAPEEKLIPYKGLEFHVKEFSDMVWEFVVEKEQVKALKQTNPSGEYVFPRK